MGHILGTENPGLQSRTEVFTPLKWVTPSKETLPTKPPGPPEPPWARKPRRRGQMQPPSRAALAWYQSARAVVAAACWSAWRVRVVGAENIPQTTPFILCPVHRSYIDTLLIACIARRRARFMGHSGVFYRPWVARVFSSLGGFPVHPGPDRAALRTCLDGLALGEPLVVHPRQRPHRAGWYRWQREGHADRGQTVAFQPHRHGGR
jgi:hypothetical protein